MLAGDGMNKKLENMGYLAHLVMHLLEIAGPLTEKQMERWLNPGLDGQLHVTIERLARKGLIILGAADLWFIRVDDHTGKIRPVEDSKELADTIADVLVKEGYIKRPF